jgi:glycosyltransferase involved in cell wall biosynthesis
MSKLVSIIVPCYNQAQYLPETLQSVLDQIYTNWECIIVNDGSPDNTEEIALEWCKKDERFVYFKKENGGLSSARNAGLKIAKGDYIQFLDSDDLLYNDKLQKQISFFNKTTDIIICDFFPFDQDSGDFLKIRYMNPFPSEQNYKNDIIIKWETELSIPCHCVLFKKELINQDTEIQFDESLPNHEDWVFWVKLFYHSKGIHNINEVLVSYRIHNKSMCSDTVLMKKGFIDACNSNKAYFISKKDKKVIKLCKEKYNRIQGITKITLKVKLYSILENIKDKIISKKII